VAETLDAGELEAGERLLANTTPAGWEVYDQPHSEEGWLIFGPDGDGLVTCHGNTGYGFTGGPPGGDPETDARALVWLRNAAPALIALARAGLAAQAEIARLSRILNELERAVDAALEAAAFAQKRKGDGDAT